MDSFLPLPLNISSQVRFTSSIQFASYQWFVWSMLLTCQWKDPTALNKTVHDTSSQVRAEKEGPPTSSTHPPPPPLCHPDCMKPKIRKNRLSNWTRYYRTREQVTKTINEVPDINRKPHLMQPPFNLQLCTSTNMALEKNGFNDDGDMMVDLN